MEKWVFEKHLPLLLSTVTFSFISKVVFDNVFTTSSLIIDEEFHLPQGLLYCNFTFNTWNAKITTLPGLYLITALFLGPFSLCSVYWLRFVNLIGSVINLLIFNVYLNLQETKTPWHNLISCVNLALLPPLYFFGHLYYTDVLSVTFVLSASICSRNNRHIFACILGAMAILMRQTNIIWIGFMFGQYILKEVLLYSSKKSKRSRTAMKELKWEDAIEIVTNLNVVGVLKKLSKAFWLNVGMYSLLFLSFVTFVFVNGSIVLGDKTAHEASLHLPQLFYFILFCLVFGWPFFVVYVKRFLIHIRKMKLSLFFVAVAFGITIYCNTVEHPYLLADNRHYTFYIWNRFYRRYKWFRYAIVPIYYFGLLGIISNMNCRMNAVFTFMYFTCTIAVLILQKMIEIRYFLLPYVFFRLNIKCVQLWQLILEFVTMVLINIVAFHTFYTKNIYWSDFESAQKLIW